MRKKSKQVLLVDPKLLKKLDYNYRLCKFVCVFDCVRGLWWVAGWLTGGLAGGLVGCRWAEIVRFLGGETIQGKFQSNR